MKKEDKDKDLYKKNRYHLKNKLLFTDSDTFHSKQIHKNEYSATKNKENNKIG